MSEVLLIQNTRIEGSGHLGNLLSNDGFDITSVHAKHEEIPKKKFCFHSVKTLIAFQYF